MGLGDLGVPVAVSGGGAAADLFICSAVCVQEPERDRSSWEQKKPPGGAGGPSTSATGPDTRAEPPDQERLEGASLLPPHKGFSGALVLVCCADTCVPSSPGVASSPGRGAGSWGGGQHPHWGQGPHQEGRVLPGGSVLTGRQGPCWGQRPCQGQGPGGGGGECPRWGQSHPGQHPPAGLALAQTFPGPCLFCLPCELPSPWGPNPLGAGLCISWSKLVTNSLQQDCPNPAPFPQGPHRSPL